MDDIKKVKDLIKALQNYVEKYPECAEYQILYSHDDEGNEYQRVINLPTICKLTNPLQKSYRFLEVEGFLSVEFDDIKDCNAVIIN